MLQKIITRFKKERSHFDNLGDVVKHLLYSYGLYLISYPIIGIFINAYFWRQTEDITLIAAYNLGFFIFLPLGFYVNGLLLKRIKITKLYLVGLIISTISTVAVIFFSGNNLWYFLAYGAIFGFGSGIYWANRNFLGFQEKIYLRSHAGASARAETRRCRYRK